MQASSYDPAISTKYIGESWLLLFMRLGAAYCMLETNASLFELCFNLKRVVGKYYVSKDRSSKLFLFYTERIRAKPVVLPIDNATALVGSNVTLECKAMSDSMPHFQWLRWFSLGVNSSRNQSYEIISQNSVKNKDQMAFTKSSEKFEFHGIDLTLVNVTKEESGRYTCIVGNALGYAVKDTYLHVHEKIGELSESALYPNDSAMLFCLVFLFIFCLLMHI